MIKIFSIITSIFVFQSVGESVVQWPELTNVKFVSARVATEEDINDGAAVFMLQNEGVSIGTPITIPIPQYAFHIDAESGKKTKVVIIQAEEANGQKVIGALVVATQEFMVGLYNEFQFLGVDKPKE